jgi:hypothetical protein
MRTTTHVLAAVGFSLALLVAASTTGHAQIARPASDVIVVNTPAVRDADNPTRQPLQAADECQAPSSGCGGTIYTVPLGKRLVIEYVSMTASIPVGEVAELRVQTTAGGAGIVHYLPLTAPAVLFNGFGRVSTGQQLRLYVDPGDSVNLEAIRSDSAGDGFFRFSLSGYLVDAQ